MGLVSFDPYARVGVLVCDECDDVLAKDGTKLSKKHRDSEPDDLAPHHDSRDDVIARASGVGWARDGARWSCPDCTPKH